jgi:hypothetical protein
MTTAEKISIALPPEMAAHRPQRHCHWRIRFHQRSHSRCAARLVVHKRSARQQGITDLRQFWQEAMT